MKLFLAATLVALSTKHASAYKIVLQSDNTHCVMAIPYDATSWTGLVTATTLTTKNDGDAGSTHAPNGVNDPNTDILAAARTAWKSGVFDGSTDPTIYTAGGSTPLTIQPTVASTTVAQGGTALLPATLTFCKYYSTTAPAHSCVADGNWAGWQEEHSKASASDCCKTNHPSEYNKCMEQTTGVPPMYDATQWYADWNTKRCVRNCDVKNLYVPTADTTLYTDSPGTYTPAFATYECGGQLATSDGDVATASVATYANPTACCTAVFTSFKTDYCEWLSTTDANPSNQLEYPGGSPTMWWADSSDSICKPDCPDGKHFDSATPAVVANPVVDGVTGATTSTPCGGTVTDAYVTLYADSATCCSGSWLGAAANSGCEARSDAGDGQPTSLYFASSDGCYQDCAVAVGAPNCKTAPKSSFLYQTATACCEAHFAWLNLGYCETRADPNYPNTGGTDKYYVDYLDGVCRKDCPESAAVGAEACELSSTGALTLGWYADAATCCKEKLASQEQTACKDASEQGKGINDVATDLWYVNPSSSSSKQPCAKDCAVSVGDPACGGIVDKNGVRLFADVATCCSEAFGYVNKDYCETISGNPAFFSDLWYVDYGSNACHKDCDPASSAECKGHPKDLSTKLYGTVESCCERMGWIEKDTCKARSESGSSAEAESPGTGEWRKNPDWKKCVLDCKKGDTIAQGDAILAVQPLLPVIFGVPGITLAQQGTYPDQCDGVSTESSNLMYKNSVVDCCKSISWQQAETCQSLSTGYMSQMFYVDPSSKAKCFVQQVADNSAQFPAPAVVCASGKVFNTPADATGVTCNTNIDPSTKLYPTLDECCETHVAWDKQKCIYDSRGTADPGSQDWYIDWGKEQCVQDCPKETAVTIAPSCNGNAQSWQKLYTSKEDCCDQISWVKASECQYYNTA